MTYGEAHVAEKDSLDLIDGVWTQTVHVEHIPKPMNEKDAVLYYNSKLFKHWVNDYDYDKRISLKRKKEIVSAFMFGDSQKYLNYEELK